MFCVCSSGCGCCSSGCSSGSGCCSSGCSSISVCCVGGILSPAGGEDLQDSEGVGREEIETVTASV